MKKLGFILIGIVIIAAGIFMLVRGNKMEKVCTAEAVGTVVGIKEETTHDAETGTSSTSYYPVIKYVVGDKIISKQYETGYGADKYKVEDKVDILYNPDNVEEYLIKGDSSSKTLGIVFIVAGVLVTCVGIFKKNV